MSESASATTLASPFTVTPTVAITPKPNVSGSVTAARTRVQLSDKAIEVAASNVKSERGSYLAGKSSNFSVMQRQTQLIDAKIARGRAVADYHTSVATLQFLSGTILEQYGVNVRPGVRGR